MLKNANTLSYISEISGKSILIVRNDVEEEWYTYLLDSFSPANHSNHIYDNTVSGKDLSGILTSLGGYSHGFDNSGEIAILSKINELVSIKFTFNGFRWIKIN